MTQKPSLAFFFSFFAIVPATLLLHEFSHWLAGRALGYEMWFTFTRAGPVAGAWRNAADYALVSAAGPAFTIATALVGAWLAIARKSLLGYELVFTAFMQRLMAMVMSAIGTANDEARISLFLGLDWWVLPTFVVASLLLLTALSSHALRFSVISNVLCFVFVAAAITLMVALDGQLPGGIGDSILEPLLPEAVRRE